ncbi:hypothetical protein BLA29_007813, partial [Euroglyphus maynei]
NGDGQQQQSNGYLTFKEANIFAKKQLKRFQQKNPLHHHRSDNLAVINGLSGSDLINSDNNNHHDGSGGLMAVRQQQQRNKRGISDECCHGLDGCSWEEYAEYCPANVRLRS